MHSSVSAPRRRTFSKLAACSMGVELSKAESRKSTLTSPPPYHESAGCSGMFFMKVTLGVREPALLVSWSAAARIVPTGASMPCCPPPACARATAATGSPGCPKGILHLSSSPAACTALDMRNSRAAALASHTKPLQYLASTAT